MRIEDLQDPSKPFATYYKGRFFISYEMHKNDHTFRAYFINSYDELDYIRASEHNYHYDVLLLENINIPTNSHRDIISFIKKLPKQFPELAL